LPLSVNQVDVDLDDSVSLLGLSVLDDEGDNVVPLGKKRKVPAACLPTNNIGDRVVGDEVALVNLRGCQTEQLLQRGFCATLVIVAELLVRNRGCRHGGELVNY